ncbi:glycosyltransferase family protein [Oryzifoliimicrobium ureilyticus]|uniref:glycosyltransferase family protein n=1 Tax=Oryzifoliimicrobium ureilyticus TaxID=3113724 RepID=UPI003076723E
MNKRVLFYVQHLLGIGHIARASRVANALAKQGFDVTVVTGGLPVPGFPGDKICTVALPPVVAANTGFSGLADRDGNPAREEFLNIRRDLLLATLHDIKPAIVVIEAFPFGRRQMRFELLPLLSAIADMSPRPKIVSSVRDVLQENRKPGRDQETVDLIRAHFDAVLVHGDPSFIRLEETFSLAVKIQDRIHYTGLVAPAAPPAPTEAFGVLVSAGGGAVGRDLLDAALQASHMVAQDKRWLLIAGPNLPEDDFQALSMKTPDHVSVVRFRRDFPSLMRGAELSVSQAGYNTVCDLLIANCRSILVPFVAGGETEQTVRARRLADMGIASIISEDALTAERLAEDIANALSKPKPVEAGLDLKGADKSAQILLELLAAGEHS